MSALKSDDCEGYRRLRMQRNAYMARKRERMGEATQQQQSVHVSRAIKLVLH